MVSNGRASANASYNYKLIDMSTGTGVSHSNDNSISYQHYPTSNPIRTTDYKPAKKNGYKIGSSSSIVMKDSSP